MSPESEPAHRYSTEDFDAFEERGRALQGGRVSTTTTASDDGGRRAFGPGERHEALTRHATFLRKSGLSSAAALAALREFNAERCEPPKADAELANLVTWTVKRVNVGERNAFDVEPIGNTPLPARTWPLFFGGDADGSAEHRFVVDDLIHEASIVMIHGRQGSLKTPLVMDIGGHVARGVRYLGRETTKGAVLYVAAEGAGAIQKRIAGIYAEHPGLDRHAFACVPVAVDLGNPTEAAAFGEFVVRETIPQMAMPIRVVIFDTLAKSIPGESDSDDAAISRLEASARVIARLIAEASANGFEPASILLHHPRKNDPVYRGSGSIEGNFDTILAVTRTDAEKLEDRVYEVAIEKCKDGPTDIGWSYRAALVHVGTTPRGKENFAPVVRYLDAENAAALKAETKIKGRKLTKTVRHLIELIVRIQTRDGRHEVPRDVLAKSGFLAHVEYSGWDPDVPVHGIPLDSLRDAFFAEDDDAGRSAVGERSVSEKTRSRWRRRLENLKTSGAAWVCDGWVWNVGE